LRETLRKSMKSLFFRSQKTVSLISLLENNAARGFTKLKNWRFDKRLKILMVFAIIAIVLVSVFSFLPKGNQTIPETQARNDVPVASPSSTPHSNVTQAPIPNPLSAITNAINQASKSFQTIINPKLPGTIEKAGGMNSSVWQQVANNAWNYFQPDIGVDANTSLPRSGIGAPFFTDWDLGVYIQAVIDANQTGLISNNGAWGSSQRLEKIVQFLETRELNNASYPYWFYQSSDGKDYHAISDSATSPVDGVDTGRLLIALNNLRDFNASLTQRINSIVLEGQYHNRSNYAAMVPAVKSESLASTSIYAYYVYSGFASFWPDQLSEVPDKILDNILSAGNTTTPQNVTLPIASILGDPLICSVFELNKSSQLMYIMRQDYLAHEAYFNATGNYRAFSEGGTPSTTWAYEWTVYGNQTWVVLDQKGQVFGDSPMIYTKIALSFLAIYNSTYAYNMAVYLEKILPDPSNGYSEGMTENQDQLPSPGLNTNGMIIGAAKYFIQMNP
jgi:Protein of unknown function (DUF3131)